jgi:predicted RNA-binding Zn ribbon-like protein
MRESHSTRKFQLLGGHLVLDFTNTIDNRGSDREVELIPDYRSLIAFLEQTQAISGEEARRLARLASQVPESAEVIANEAQWLRESLYKVLSAAVDGQPPPPADLAVVSRACRQAGSKRDLIAGEREFHWRWVGDDESLQKPLWILAAAAGELVTSKDLTKVGRCADPTCNWLFLDTTKSHTRRWCEMRVCGNRDKARRFYRKRQAQ